jgi:hypothetical protein
MNDVCDIWSSPWRTLHRSAPHAPAAAARQQAVRQTALWQEGVTGNGSWLGRARTVASLKTRIRFATTAAL